MYEINLGIIHLQDAEVEQTILDKGGRIIRSAEVSLRSGVGFEHPDSDIQIMVLLRYWKFGNHGMRTSQHRLFRLNQYLNLLYYQGRLSAPFSNEEEMIHLVKQRVADFFAGR